MAEDSGVGLPPVVWTVLRVVGAGALRGAEGDSGAGAKVDAGRAEILGHRGGRISFNGRNSDWERSPGRAGGAIADDHDRDIWIVYLGAGAGGKPEGSFCVVRERCESGVAGSGLGCGGLGERPRQRAQVRSMKFSEEAGNGCSVGLGTGGEGPRRS